MGPKPAWSPAWLFSGLGGALMPPSPDESGSSGHASSACEGQFEPFS